MNQLNEISIKKRYEDELGEIRVMGFVENYVVWRRKGAAPSLCSLNEFSKRFKEASHED